MIAGLTLLFYPLVANTWNNHVQSKLVNNYTESVSEAIESGTINAEGELQKAYQYNEDLLPCILPDSFAQAEANGVDERYMSILNANGDGIMGYIQIPSIKVKLPIFHTTNEDVLQIGVGHLEGSSLPVGGPSTHSVLSAHRGLPSATLFTDLDKVEIGEDFFIIIMDEYYAYEIDSIDVVEPDDTSLLQVEEGKDLCTLITCTPYGVNTQRLMVRGHRVEYTPKLLEDAKTPAFGAVSLHTNYLLWVIVGLSIVAAFILILYLIDRHRNKRAEVIETKDI
ncbi:sortase A [Pseudobutyrivibrio sp. 49]|uniref:class C sortase n=1 Tax=Pseudobutyrivibrio sp. 49 TaxID=1855344 RepID=UPI00088398D2|nr:class C sortase [Pseudobutyrivibrio sp. 49]SDH95856.1 sortase A [Pseudobutyrivibrio sp. 49]